MVPDTDAVGVGQRPMRSGLPQDQGVRILPGRKACRSPKPLQAIVVEICVIIADSELGAHVAEDPGCLSGVCECDNRCSAVAVEGSISWASGTSGRPRHLAMSTP